MTEALIFLAYALIVLALLGLLYWGLKSTDLPQPVKTCIIIVVVALGIIYFLGSGYMPQLPRRG